MIDLSFIIPTRAKQKNLYRCLDSISKFASGVDIIVVSGDDDVFIKKMLSDYNHLNIKATRHKGHSGLVAPSWKGVILSDKKFVGIVADDIEFFVENSDDIIYEKMLKAESVFEKRHELIFGHPFTRRDFWLSGGGYPICYEHYYCDSEYSFVGFKHGGVSSFDILTIHHQQCFADHDTGNVDKYKVIREGANDVGSHAQEDWSKHDKILFDKRITWWRENDKPSIIPHHIGL